MAGQQGVKMIVMSAGQAAQASAAGGKPITITVPGQQGGPAKTVTIQGKPGVGGTPTILSSTGQILSMPGQGQVSVLGALDNRSSSSGNHRNLDNFTLF